MSPAAMAPFVGVAAALPVAVALFRAGRPVRRALGSGGLGLSALLAVNVAGAFTGVSFGLNTLTLGASFVLGVPGVVLLLLLKTLFFLG